MPAKLLAPGRLRQGASVVAGTPGRVAAATAVGGEHAKQAAGAREICYTELTGGISHIIRLYASLFYIH